MIFRADKLQTALPIPKHPSPQAAAAVQELMGGKAGEMSTLMNYFFQSCNFRGRDQYEPFYKLVTNIAAEEWGHVELVASAINLLLTGTMPHGNDPTAEPLKGVLGHPFTSHYFMGGQTALPMDSMGRFWDGSFVQSSGSIKVDLVHNVFLEYNARATKLKVYETTSDPTVRELAAFLLVRGTVHIFAYSKALEKLSGVNMLKLFPAPNMSTHKFPEARKYIEQGLYNTMYSFSNYDISRIGEIWNGPHPDGAPDFVVTKDPIPTAVPIRNLPGEPQVGAPDVVSTEPGFVQDVANFIFGGEKNTRPPA